MMYNNYWVVLDLYKKPLVLFFCYIYIILVPIPCLNGTENSISNLIIQKINNLILILVLILKIKLGSNLDLGLYMIALTTRNKIPYN